MIWKWNEDGLVFYFILTFWALIVLASFCSYHSIMRNLNTCFCITLIKTRSRKRKFFIECHLTWIQSSRIILKKKKNCFHVNFVLTGDLPLVTLLRTGWEEISDFVHTMLLYVYWKLIEMFKCHHESLLVFVCIYSFICLNFSELIL